MAIDQITTGIIKDDAVTNTKVADNLTLPGSYVKIPAITTVTRDALSASVGMLIYNSTLNIVQQYNATGWASVDSPPMITSIDYPGSATALDTVGEFTDATCDYNNDATIAHDANTKMRAGMTVSGTGIPAGATIASVTSTTAFELSASTTGGAVTNGTLTFNSEVLIIAGSNFQSNPTVTIDGTAPRLIQRNGASQITCTGMPAKSAQTYAAGLVVTNPTGLSSSSDIDYSADPQWTTASGELGTFGLADTISTIDLVATGDAPITYAITTGALPTNLGMSTTTGDITGTVGGGATAGTYNFTVTATDAEVQTALRSFNIRLANIAGGGTITEYGNYYVHTFRQAQSGDQFIVPAGGLTVDILVIGGGGSGGTGDNLAAGDAGGGGGAGNAIWKMGLVLAEASYDCTVGAGGTAPTVYRTQGENGNATKFGQDVSSPNTNHRIYAGHGTGGGQNNAASLGPGSAGGSTGGVGGGGTARDAAAASPNSDTYANDTANQYLNKGGNKVSPSSVYGGTGGGGAGGAGVNMTGGISIGGAAGDGRKDLNGISAANFKLLLDSASIGVIDGIDRYVGGGGGGGGGGSAVNAGGAGGKGGGGNGGESDGSPAPVNGVDGTGSGGGGAGSLGASAGDGGDGVIIIRYEL